MIIQKIKTKLKNKTFLLNLFLVSLLIIVYLFFRLYNHQERVEYSSDPGSILLDTYEIWKNKNPKLIGPMVSHGSEGRFFFHGPYVYYFLLPGMILFNWDPIGGSIITILWNIIGVVVLYFIGLNAKSKHLGFLLGLIYATNPFLILYSSFVWNPNFLPFISVLIAYLLLQKKKNNYTLLKLGILFGVGILLHYQMVMILPVLLYCVFRSKNKLTSFMYMGLGTFIGLTPMILFELKNNFYNIKTVLLIFGGNSYESAGYPLFYFMVPIILFTILFIIFIYKKTSIRNKRFLLIFISLLTVINLGFGINSLLKKRIQLSLIELQFAAEIIDNKKLDNFNVANLTTGNTRATALRYLLKYRGLDTMTVEAYPQAENLFVLSRDDNAVDVEQNPVWEITSFNGKVVESWKLGDDSEYYLYLLKK